MITVRLTRLKVAYARARELVGDANRGKAIPGIALRWCHRIRLAIRAEERAMAARSGRYAQLLNQVDQARELIQQGKPHSGSNRYHNHQDFGPRGRPRCA